MSLASQFPLLSILVFHNMRLKAPHRTFRDFPSTQFQHLHTLRFAGLQAPFDQDVQFLVDTVVRRMTLSHVLRVLEVDAWSPSAGVGGRGDLRVDVRELRREGVLGLECCVEGGSGVV
ncbi:hypothetical protein HDU98_008268, partial [Podochytrium sp. JEL0797]